VRWGALLGLVATAGCIYDLPDHVTVVQLDAAAPGDASGPDGGAGEASGPGGGADYRALVVADGPLSYWRLGEKSGTTTARDEMNANPGTYEGQPELGTQGLLPRDKDTAVTFHGTNDLVTSQANAYGGDFTLEALVKASAYPSGLVGILCAEEYSKSGFRFGIDQAGRLQLWASESGGAGAAETAGGAIFDPADPGSLGKTHHVAAVREGTGKALVTIYVDGNGSGAGDVTIVPTPAGTMVGGTCHSNYFNGVIDEVAVYARALPKDRIAAHAQAAGVH
jgi:hypothetical protein